MFGCCSLLSTEENEPAELAVSVPSGSTYLSAAELSTMKLRSEAWYRYSIESMQHQVYVSACLCMVSDRYGGTSAVAGGDIHNDNIRKSSISYIYCQRVRLCFLIACV